MKVFPLAAVIFFVLPVACLGQEVWRAPYRQQTIQPDGSLEDWQGVPVLSLTPSASGIRTEGDFGADDLRVQVRALWDEQALYLAVSWVDNQWDVQEIRRRDAVYITGDQRRRDRMLFYDNLRFEIRSLDLNYLIWISPRVGEQGPFYWQRLLEGSRNLEAGIGPPSISPKFVDDKAGLEILLRWDQLKTKPRDWRKKGLPIQLQVTDSDLRGQGLESKLPHLKWLEWSGRLILEPKEGR